MSEQTDPHAIYHTSTLNDYFAGPGFGERFDLIYLDGLHTFEQTLIDFHAALQMSHDRTVVLIDDTGGKRRLQRLSESEDRV